MPKEFVTCGVRVRDILPGDMQAILGSCYLYRQHDSGFDLWFLTRSQLIPKIRNPPTAQLLKC